MPKRKRGSDASSPAADGTSIQNQRAAFKLDQNVRKLAHAFKIAKGFERQKLGRRQKKATCERNIEGEEVLVRINAEIAALKTLDNATSARHLFFKSLLRIKAVSACSALPGEVRRFSAGQLALDPARLNVHARLCNSNPVREVLPLALEEVQRALGIEVVKGGKGGKRLRAKDFEEGGPGGVVGDGEGKRGQGGSQKRVKKEDDEEEEEEGEESDDVDERGGDSDGSAMFADFDDRLGSSDGEHSDDDDDDIDDLEKQLELEGIQQRANPSKTQKPSQYDLSADLSLSDAAEPESSPNESSPEPRKAPALKKTTFLPSLSMGGYVSGSGSDLDDADMDVAPKKNRRGQRARQQIWEKKFGAKAKHVQAGGGSGAAADRNAGWDAKRGATESFRGGPQRFRGRGRGGGIGGRGGRGASTTTPTGSNGLGVAERKPAKKDDSGPLHPSWEAAKRAKEKKSAPVAFQGKKMTFD